MRPQRAAPSGTGFRLGRPDDVCRYLLKCDNRTAEIDRAAARGWLPVPWGWASMTDPVPGAPEARTPPGDRRDAGEWVCIHADPWLRLPLQTGGAVCLDPGEHSRSFWGDRVTLVCAPHDDNGRWEVDPTWALDTVGG